MLKIQKFLRVCRERKYLQSWGPGRCVRRVQQNASRQGAEIVCEDVQSGKAVINRDIFPRWEGLR